MVTPRAAAPRLLLQQLLIVVVLVALGAVPTRGTAAAKDKPAPSPASATDFLRACCAATRNDSICYGSLLPRAGYFHGSHVKVARAAAAGAFAQLRSFRRIRLGGGVLPGCALDVVAGMEGYRKSLAALHRFERTASAGPGTEQQARRDLFEAREFISGAGSSAARCFHHFVDAGGHASTLFGKDLADWVGSVELYVGIALDLVNSIAL